MRILLLSGDVHCGKTTLLTAWCKRAIAAGAVVEGIIAGPDVDGCRHLTSIPSFTSRRLQLARGEAPPAAPASVVSVGGFSMLEDVFAWARARVLEPLHESSRCARCALGPRDCECAARYLVLDEIGPLELRRGEGLEPAVSQAFARMNAEAGRVLRNVAVIAVVRSQCADEFIAHYGIKDPVTPFVNSSDWRLYSQGVDPQFPFKRVE